MRCVMTRVFPLPAPDKMRSGPSVCWTASRWTSFKELNRLSVNIYPLSRSIMGKVHCAIYTCKWCTTIPNLFYKVYAIWVNFARGNIRNILFAFAGRGCIQRPTDVNLRTDCIVGWVERIIPKRHQLKENHVFSIQLPPQRYGVKPNAFPMRFSGIWWYEVGFHCVLDEI